MHLELKRADWRRTLHLRRSFGLLTPSANVPCSFRSFEDVRSCDPRSFVVGPRSKSFLSALALQPRRSHNLPKQADMADLARKPSKARTDQYQGGTCKTCVTALQRLTSSASIVHASQAQLAIDCSSQSANKRKRGLRRDEGAATGGGVKTISLATSAVTLISPSCVATLWLLQPLYQAFICGRVRNATASLHANAPSHVHLWHAFQPKQLYYASASSQHLCCPSNVATVCVQPEAFASGYG